MKMRIIVFIIALLLFGGCSMKPENFLKTIVIDGRLVENTFDNKDDLINYAIADTEYLSIVQIDIENANFQDDSFFIYLQPFYEGGEPILLQADYPLGIPVKLNKTDEYVSSYSNSFKSEKNIIFVNNQVELADSLFKEYVIVPIYKSEKYESSYNIKFIFPFNVNNYQKW